MDISVIREGNSFEGVAPVRLLVNDNEVCSCRIRFPEMDDFRRVCQLIGIPFREDKRAGVFSVHPPLIGARIMVDLVGGAADRQNPMYEMLPPALRQIERFLWIAGATAATSETDPMAGASPSGGQWPQCDARVLVYPGAIRPQMTGPSVAYPWWPLPFRCRHLGLHLAAACQEFTHFRAGCGLAWGLSPDVGSWFGELVRAVPVPTALFAIPMVEGYVDILLESIALVICEGIIGSFHKPYLEPSVCREIMNRSAATEASSIAARLDESELATTDVATPDTATPGLPRQAETPQGELERTTAPPITEAPVQPEIQSLGQPTELAPAQAREFLASRGIEPSSELVDEYLLFLQRFPQG